MPLRRDLDPHKLEWLEWYSRKRKRMIAFAVDPGSERPLAICPKCGATGRKSLRRAINGSLVPAQAVPAKRSTERDPYCLEIVKRVQAKK